MTHTLSLVNPSIYYNSRNQGNNTTSRKLDVHVHLVVLECVFERCTLGEREREREGTLITRQEQPTTFLAFPSASILQSCMQEKVTLIIQQTVHGQQLYKEKYG